MLSALRKQGCTQAEIARQLDRHRSTISRELRRNCSRWDGHYRPSKAIEKTAGRRSRSRRNHRFGKREFSQVVELLRQNWSPEQISGRLKRDGLLSISHETIDRYVWQDKYRSGSLHRHLRCATKQRRKRYRSGRLAGKRHISERPASVEGRSQLGHWEIDTVMGSGDQHCIVTLVERKSGYTLVGKLKARTKEEAARRTTWLIGQHAHLFRTITADNGTEFHSYADIEAATGVKFYFATPHHSWERGTNENTNGLIRQYLPKRASMKAVTQQQCSAIAELLNERPRKRLGYRTPRECVYGY
jgi:transposase, IS30 family